MFNFHKPRTYRSAEGCCICRAKSSSSRFTDSRKYERDTMQCFDLKYPRHGEICNACVLLVKRFKRLPVGSKRHWGHVVDARAGPGTNKIQTKYKSERNRNCVNNRNNKTFTNADPNSNTENGSSTTANNDVSGISFIPEKFSKIFKKSKKSKDFCVGKRKSVNVACPQKSVATNSLPVTPDSLESDYEDRLMQTYNSNSTGAVVRIETKTRTSTCRAVAVAATVADKRKRALKLGSKRRKCFVPRKNRRMLVCEETVRFFDDDEWRERKSCCGIVYECAALGGALIIDLANFQPCEEHKVSVESVAINKLNSQTEIVAPSQKAIIATMPAVVQLAPPSAPQPPQTPTIIVNSKHTPVLKKHHLFFKRQSECFPQGDIVTAESNPQATSDSRKLSHTNSIITTQQSVRPTVSNCVSSTGKAIISENLMSVVATTTGGNSSINITHIPRHSNAKLTTISPPLTSNSNSNGNSNTTTTASQSKSQGFLHKMKADTGKIVKHSLEKLNTAVRIKPSDLQDMKNVIKAVDKSFVLAKPTTSTITTLPNNGYQIPAGAHYQIPPLTTATLSASSPTPSTSSSSSSSTKFSDNSSDSGFDENMQDRKSASPSQEDTEKKSLSRPGVQTMILASGVQIQGQQQNLLLTGNEVAAKILQNRKHHQLANVAQQNYRGVTSNAATSAVKIAQITTAVPVGVSTQAKMRAIYNNNAIQHENGVTTIVPASSLAACTQTAAMNAVAPSTVTITPAPSSAGVGYLNHHNLTKKLTTTNIIGLQSSNLPTTSQLHTNINGNHISSSLNQKIILLKASTTSTSTSTKHSDNSSSIITSPRTLMH